jgi:toxin-antitoxin system PIN domain toxin
MTHLLDANILIALCDELHAHHANARRWFKGLRNNSWATCPLTENAFLRITSNSSYPRSTGSVTEQSAILRELCKLPRHEFWPDDISLLRGDIWSDLDRVKSADLTDLYLLALAVKRGGAFATLDHSIPSERIQGGKEALLLL